MKSHLKRPTLWLPTRVLHVPCDYEPPKEAETTVFAFRAAYIGTSYAKEVEERRRRMFLRTIEGGETE